LTLGVAADLGDTDFGQSEQPAAITPERETPGIGMFASTASVRTTTRNLGLYATDTLSLTEALAATASARYIDARVALTDRRGQTPAIDGSHRYSRLNPAGGITYTPSARMTAFASWSQGMRVPSPVELACADPNA